VINFHARRIGSFLNSNGHIFHGYIFFYNFTTLCEGFKKFPKRSVKFHFLNYNFERISFHFYDIFFINDLLLASTEIDGWMDEQITEIFDIE